MLYICCSIAVSFLPSVRMHSFPSSLSLSLLLSLCACCLSPPNYNRTTFVPKMLSSGHPAHPPSVYAVEETWWMCGFEATVCSLNFAFHTMRTHSYMLSTHNGIQTLHPDPPWDKDTSLMATQDGSLVYDGWRLGKSGLHAGMSGWRLGKSGCRLGKSGWRLW